MAIPEARPAFAQPPVPDAAADAPLEPREVHVKLRDSLIAAVYIDHPGSIAAWKVGFTESLDHVTQSLQIARQRQYAAVPERATEPVLPPGPNILLRAMQDGAAFSLLIIGRPDGAKWFTLPVPHSILTFTDQADILVPTGGPVTITRRNAYAANTKLFARAIRILDSIPSDTAPLPPNTIPNVAVLYGTTYESPEGQGQPASGVNVAFLKHPGAQGYAGLPIYTLIESVGDHRTVPREPDMPADPPQDPVPVGRNTQPAAVV